MKNRNTSKELLDKFEAAVRIHENSLESGAIREYINERLAAVERIRKDLIEICDFSIDQEV